MATNNVPGNVNKISFSNRVKNEDALVSLLKRLGIRQSDMAPAIKEILSYNNINDAKNIDNDRLNIQQSVFTKYASDNPFEVHETFYKDETLLPYNTEIKDDTQKLPEIFNDDDYDVVDYDDYYSFGSNAENTNGVQDSSSKNTTNPLDDSATKEIIDKALEKFKLTDLVKRYIPKDEVKEIYEKANGDIKKFIEGIIGAISEHTNEINKNKSGFDDITISDEDNFLTNGSMDMDMQSDSFNPQG